MVRAMWGAAPTGHVPSDAAEDGIFLSGTRDVGDGCGADDVGVTGHSGAGLGSALNIDFIREISLGGLPAFIIDRRILDYLPLLDRDAVRAARALTPGL